MISCDYCISTMLKFAAQEVRPLHCRHMAYPVTAPLDKDFQDLCGPMQRVCHVGKGNMEQGGKSSATGGIGPTMALHLLKILILLHSVKYHVIMSNFAKHGKQLVRLYTVYSVSINANQVKVLFINNDIY